MSGTSAEIAQAGLVALTKDAPAASVGQAGALALTGNHPAAEAAQAGMVVLTGNQPSAVAAQGGLMAFVEYANPYFSSAAVAQAGAIVLTAASSAASVIQSGLMVFVSYQAKISAPAPEPSIVPANGDIALIWDEQNGFADFQMSGPDLLTDAGLHTAIIISLFTDRVADADDVIPDGSTDRRGWWGDAYSTASPVNGYPDLIGSRLWLLERTTLTQQTLNQAQDYCNEALAWMLEDGIVGSIDVTCTAITINTMQIVIAYTQDGELKKFSTKWSALS